MMNKVFQINAFCLLLLFLITGIPTKTLAQHNNHIVGLSIPELRMNPILPKRQFNWISMYKPIFSANEASVLYMKRPQLGLPNDYYQHIGFFCKGELKMEQQAKMPVRFRLGTTDYVNQLEGK